MKLKTGLGMSKCLIKIKAISKTLKLTTEKIRYTAVIICVNVLICLFKLTETISLTKINASFCLNSTSELKAFLMMNISH